MPGGRGSDKDEDEKDPGHGDDQSVNEAQDPIASVGGPDCFTVTVTVLWPLIA